MKLDQIIEAAEKVGFSRTHSGVVRLWLCNAQDIEKLVKLAVQRERDELFVMFMEAHECAKDDHNYWHAAANKIKARGEV